MRFVKKLVLRASTLVLAGVVAFAPPAEAAIVDEGGGACDSFCWLDCSHPADMAEACGYGQADATSPRDRPNSSATGDLEGASVEDTAFLGDAEEEILGTCGSTIICGTSHDRCEGLQFVMCYNGQIGQ